MLDLSTTFIRHCLVSRPIRKRPDLISGKQVVCQVLVIVAVNGFCRYSLLFVISSLCFVFIFFRYTQIKINFEANILTALLIMFTPALL